MVSSPCLSPIGAKLTSYYSSKSVNGRMELVILSQPEEQHRARYLTEGSRGAIKDITGMGHPVVKLNGYYSRHPIKLECYIGHDKHNGLPHLFYQASKISGKNSTQCTACKVEGTSVIVMNLLPEHGMQATIDCVGILKERNVDVEQKLLNLNHSNKMIDFNEHSYQSAFASISAQQPHLNGHHQTHHQNNSIGQTISPFKFGDDRRESIVSHADENSIDTMMSRADSIDDSNDVTSSRHSMIISHNHHNTDTSKSNIVPENQTSLLQNGNLVAINSRKRSVRCRLVFRVKIPETGEVLQTISTPIICTQPLGTPEICKKSISKAPFITNNLELFIIGKNFLKDSKIIFQNKKNDWMKVVEPDKEFLNSSHLICKVPDYELATSDTDMIEVELQVRSGGKFSEAHNFVYVNNTNQQQQQQQQHQQHQQHQQQQQQLEPILHNGSTVQLKFETSPPPPPQTQQPQPQVTQAQHHDQLNGQIHQQQQQQFDQQQQQQRQHAQIQEQQIQHQLVLQQQQHQQHQQQHQQQIPTSQLLTTIDLNDDTTIVYADSLEGLQYNFANPTSPGSSSQSQQQPFVGSISAGQFSMAQQSNQHQVIQSSGQHHSGNAVTLSSQNELQMNDRPTMVIGDGQPLNDNSTLMFAPAGQTSSGDPSSELVVPQNTNTMTSHSSMENRIQSASQFNMAQQTTQHQVIQSGSQHHSGNPVTVTTQNDLQMNDSNTMVISDGQPLNDSSTLMFAPNGQTSNGDPSSELVVSQNNNTMTSYRSQLPSTHLHVPPINWLLVFNIFCILKLLLVTI